MLLILLLCADMDHGAAGEGGANCSMLSSAIDEGLELSQRLCESLFSGPEGELDPEREELVLGACNHLRTAVDKLLELVSDSTVQVESPSFHWDHWDESRLMLRCFSFASPQSWSKCKLCSPC